MIPVDETWRTFSGLHGGLVVAWLAEPLLDDELEPLVISTHFLGAVDLGEVDVSVERVRTGRSTATSVVRLEQADRLRTHALVSLGRRATDHLWDPRIETSQLPQPEVLSQAPNFVPVSQHFDIRPIAGVLPGSGGDRPTYEAWIRLVDPVLEKQLGPVGAALVLIDAMPPGLLSLWTSPRPVPTVELTVHLAPAVHEWEGWIHVRHHTRWSDDATCVDETELHTMDGRLIAQGRQLRRVL